MAYSTDIDNLLPSHRYQLSSDANDSVGTNNGTTSGGVFTGTPICEDAINSYVTTALTDKITLPTITTINNSAQTRKIVAGWFMSTALQAPPTRIYGEGTDITAFQFNMAMGNNIAFEVIEPTNFTLQMFGPVMLPNRAYHLCGVFEGNGFANKATFYVDGKEMTNVEPLGSQPNTANLDIRAVGEFGDASGTTGIGGGEVLFQAGRNSQYNQWAMWDSVSLTATQIKEELFEKGALPDLIISSSTEINMQSQIDLIQDTVRVDAPLCIRVEDCTEGDFTLASNNITYNPLSSIHVQYTGNDTLTWENISGSNASLISTPVVGGSVTIVNEFDITLTNLKTATEVRIFRSSDKVELAGDESITSGTFVTTIFEETVDITIVSLDYQIQRFTNQVINSNLSIEINQVPDRYYSNS